MFLSCSNTCHLSAELVCTVHIRYRKSVEVTADACNSQRKMTEV